ncbi:hypothetical protein WJX73_009517 [Symbiochloris irregularis]|uniref:DUF455-domain-containing protein n=1 Tax=Symbiochloris irregularis TaxID=706552 RepID=A0AAW1NR53_9CHLO
MRSICSWKSSSPGYPGAPAHGSSAHPSCRPLKRGTYLKQRLEVSCANVTAPVQVNSDVKLSKAVSTPQPFWSTFCGCTNGVWIGEMAAFSPVTGNPEALALDGKGKEVYAQQMLTVEERSPDGDAIIRHNVCQGNACAIYATAASASEASTSGSTEEPNWPWAIDTIIGEDEGLVFFDGGSYSYGPVHLERQGSKLRTESELRSTADILKVKVVPDEGRSADQEAQKAQHLPEQADAIDMQSEASRQQDTHADAGFIDDDMSPESINASTGLEEEPQTADERPVFGYDDSSAYTTTSEVEHVLAWGGESRLRVRLLLSVTRGHELEVAVLRMTAVREVWEGMLDGSLTSLDQVQQYQATAAATSPKAAAPSLDPLKMGGQWKIFDLYAQPVFETDVITGERKRFYMHQVQECQQQWKAGLSQPGDDGGTYWLPGGILVELRMETPPKPPPAGPLSNGATRHVPKPRGVSISIGWMPQADTLISMHRMYNGDVGQAAPPQRPARLSKPQLVPPKQVPQYKVSGLPLAVYMLHNLAHVELNAIELAWDTVARFSCLDLPKRFFTDFAHVADDEARHFGWCRQHMQALGYDYGCMPAHNLLWQGAEASSGNVAARLAVIPLSQEARGLDAGPRLVERLVGAGDKTAAAIVARISMEETAHVAVGVYWYSRICKALSMDPGPTFRACIQTLTPDVLKGPFNHEGRSAAGLPRSWYDASMWDADPIASHSLSGMDDWADADEDDEEMQLMSEEHLLAVKEQLATILSREASAAS